MGPGPHVDVSGRVYNSTDERRTSTTRVITYQLSSSFHRLQGLHGPGASARASALSLEPAHITPTHPRHPRRGAANVLSCGHI